MPLVSTAVAIAGARSGRVISFATDTVPALAASPSQAQDIFKLKQRSPDKPLILMAATLTELLDFVDCDREASTIWRQTAKAKLPGAITLVLPVNELGRELNPGSTTIGIRIPACQDAIAILQQTGALLTTSANQSNEPPLRKMGEIADAFPQVLVVRDRDPAETTGSGLPSTVLKWANSGWLLLRQGQIGVDDLPGF